MRRPNFLISLMVSFGLSVLFNTRDDFSFLSQLSLVAFYSVFWSSFDILLRHIRSFWSRIVSLGSFSVVC